MTRLHGEDRVQVQLHLIVPLEGDGAASGARSAATTSGPSARDRRPSLRSDDRRTKWYVIPIFLDQVLPQKTHRNPFSVATYDGGIAGALARATVAGAVVTTGGGHVGVVMVFSRRFVGEVGG